MNNLVTISPLNIILYIKSFSNNNNNNNINFKYNK